ncbi:unnamed protein product [Phytophthora fragariaefolia]|uniref:Unnamed protein product n=1 Tax=Phytophthora fragariaefolia TaxID=1490495 RepID=A0A9W6XTK0_9STRA|nr:unnamed protein product [Phytophthora fragariaefolia]
MSRAETAAAGVESALKQHDPQYLKYITVDSLHGTANPRRVHRCELVSGTRPLSEQNNSTTSFFEREPWSDTYADGAPNRLFQSRMAVTEVWLTVVSAATSSQ